MAANFGRVEAGKLLLEYGANVNCLNVVSYIQLYTANTCKLLPCGLCMFAAAQCLLSVNVYL